MLFTTATQWAALAVVLVLGWVLGLMSRSGGGKYRRELSAERSARAEEQKAHATDLRERDALHAAALRDRPVDRPIDRVTDRPIDRAPDRPADRPTIA